MKIFGTLIFFLLVNKTINQEGNGCSDRNLFSRLRSNKRSSG